MDIEEHSQITIELLEVIVNQILYLRGLYPLQIFKPRRIYNTPVMISIYPTLNTYLMNVLNSAKELIRRQELECVELRIYNDTEDRVIERYKFMITKQADQAAAADAGKEFPVNKHDEYLVVFEEKLRAALYMMSEHLKDLDKLPKNARFVVRLYTTQKAFHELTHDPHQQDFVWLRALPDTVPLDRKRILLPLTKLNNVGLELFAEL